MQTISSKEALMEILRAEGVEYVFGLPGATEVFFLDALQDHPEIKYILGLHESLALGMAEGYARASGKVGFVNLHTSTGIGAAMALLINAYAGKVPLVVTAGNQDNRLIMQEPHLGDYDLTKMADQFTKWSAEVSYAADLPMVMRRAFKVAAHPPTGPVFVSLPQNLMEESIDFEYVPSTPFFTRQRPDQEAVARALELLMRSRAPVMAIGAGIATDEALPEVVKLAELIGSPVYQSHMSDVTFPVRHPQYLGNLDEDSPYTQEILQSMDILLTIGVPQFDVSKSLLTKRDADIIQVDNNPWEMAKNVPVAVGIEGNIQVTLTELNDALRERMSSEEGQAAVSRAQDILKEKERISEAFLNKARAERDNVPISASRLMEELSDALKPGTLIVDDSWSCSAALRQCMDLTDPKGYYRFRGGGTIGWAMPGGIGVKLAFPDRPVVAVSGDGSAMWANQSLWTAAAYKIPVTYVICANGRYQYVIAGKIRRMGEKAKGRLLGLEFEEPRIAFWQLAEAMGVPGQKVDRPDDLRQALRSALESDGPSVVEVTIE